MMIVKEVIGSWLFWVGVIVLLVISFLMPMGCNGLVKESNNDEISVGSLGKEEVIKSPAINVGAQLIHREAWDIRPEDFDPGDFPPESNGFAWDMNGVPRWGKFPGDRTDIGAFEWFPEVLADGGGYYIKCSYIDFDGTIVFPDGYEPVDPRAPLSPSEIQIIAEGASREVPVGLLRMMEEFSGR